MARRQPKKVKNHVETERDNGLTRLQNVFMDALQAAINAAGTPVSVEEIRGILHKSDSRVRSHIKVLMADGYICCVGKARVKRYVPSDLYLRASGIEANSEHPWMGGYCQTLSCKRKAEDYWRDGYYCRDCIVGGDSVSDTMDLRRRFEANLGVSSSAGEWLDQVWPTYDEDVEEPKIKLKRN